LGLFLFLGEGTTRDSPTSGSGIAAEGTLKIEGVCLEELDSPMGITSLSNIGLRLLEEAEKEVTEAMSVPSEGMIW